MFVGVGVVIIGGAWFFLGQKDAAMDGDAMLKEESAAMVNEKMDGGETMEKDEAMEGDSMIKKGSYESYAPERLALAASGDVVLFFRASWCPTCKALDADIRARMSAIPSDLTILDVDYDNSAELKRKYGVTYQHTFVQVDAEGNQIKKWSGSPTLSALVSEVQ